MEREVEIAKKLLESKGYNVSKKMKESEQTKRDYYRRVSRYQKPNDPIGYPEFDDEAYEKQKAEGVAREEAFISKRRKEEGAPDDYEYSGVLDKFIKKTPDGKDLSIWNESKLSDEDIDNNHGESEQGRYPLPRRGRKPNADLKDDGVFTPGSEEERDHRANKSLADSIKKTINKFHESTDEYGRNLAELPASDPLCAELRSLGLTEKDIDPIASSDEYHEYYGAKYHYIPIGYDDLESNGYEHIDTGSSDYTSGSMINFEKGYMISLAASSTGYISIQKLGPTALEKIKSGKFDFWNDRYSE